MKIIEVNSGQSPFATISQLLGARKKPAGRVEKLQEVCFVRPRVVVDTAQLAKYNAVCGFAANQGVPLIYPQMLGHSLMMQFMGSEFCPWPAMGTVHLANTIEQKQALNGGDIVRVELSTGALFAHEKGQVYTIKLRILGDGQLLWQATQSLLRVGIKQPAGLAYKSSLGSDVALSRQADFHAPGNIGRRYGWVSGDLNPIHLGMLSAKMFGFKRAIAHGMWTKARALAAILPPHPVEQVTALVEFKTPLFLPARPGLWTAQDNQATQFAVLDSRGEKPHLRGRIDFQACSSQEL